jgi:ABC-type uncharacterized transport system ATPase subunit
LDKTEQLENGRYMATIQLPDARNGNDLLNMALKQVTVISFRELLPSMNEIFIKAVSKNIQIQDHE